MRRPSAESLSGNDGGNGSGATRSGPSLPVAAGIGLKPEHFRQVLEQRPAIGFFEVHAENYMGAGGPFHHYLTRIREAYPLSLHGVGLSLGGEEPPDTTHLGRLALLVQRYQPASFSEHLAWCGHAGIFFNDLLPVPYDTPTLQRVCRHVEQVQDNLGLRMLLENPSTYLEHAQSTRSEADFLAEVVRRTGCGLLLDVNNAHVSAMNAGRHAMDFIEALPLHAVGEIHLSGHAHDVDAAGAPLLIDDHGSAVDAVVWDLFRRVLRSTGPVPVLIEWDNEVPPLPGLLSQARQAQHELGLMAQPSPCLSSRGTS
jgi:uncharacterized protein (UPF0276 family)